MTIFELLTSPIEYQFMQRAIIVTVLAAVVCGLLSCWLILVGWALIGDAISHAVLPGVVIAYALGIPFGIGAFAFALVAVLLIFMIKRTTPLKQDASIGIVFTTLFALGIVLISLWPSQVDLMHILFGNLLGVSISDAWQIAVLALIVMGALIYFRRDITLFAFDPTHAKVIGLRPDVVGAGVLVAVAATAVVSLKTVGVVLVVSLLITPGATALLLTRNVWKMLWVAPTIAGLCALVGCYVSFHVDTPPGGTIVLIQGIVYVVVWLVSLRRGRVGPPQPKQLSVTTVAR